MVASSSHDIILGILSQMNLGKHIARSKQFRSTLAQKLENSGYHVMLHNDDSKGYDNTLICLADLVPYYVFFKKLSEHPWMTITYDCEHKRLELKHNGRETDAQNVEKIIKGLYPKLGISCFDRTKKT